MDMRTDFRLGDWVVRPRRDCIERGGESIHVHPKPMAVLERLAAGRGDVVTRDELFESVWPGLIVTDDALAQCIVELRKVFGDSAHDPQVIETVPKVGFRLLLPVSELHEMQSAGSRWLKFVSGAMLVAALTAAVYTVLILRETDSLVTVVSDQAQPSVAVLPFDNQSAYPEDTFFVNGIHDDLISHIAKIGSIRTISSTSVMRYQDSKQSIPEIAAELGVTTVIEGSVQRAGEDVRINVQLIDARTDSHLWCESYDRQLSVANIFAIQSEIAESVASTLRTTLSPTEQERIRAVPTDNLGAWEAYLVGKQRMRQRTLGAMVDAVDYFQQAVELDPGFALAWVGLADALVIQLRYFPRRTWEREMRAEAEAALSTALELDKGLGEAHASLGLFRRYVLRDWIGAEQSFRRAIELSPNYASAYLWFGSLLVNTLDRIPEGTRMLETALLLDPMSGIIRRTYTLPLRYTGRFDDALEELQKVIEIDPSFALAHNNLGTMQHWVYGRYDEAARSLNRSLALEPSLFDTYMMLGHLFRDLGDLDESDRLYQRAMELNTTRHSLKGSLINAMLRGDRQSAHEWARKLIETTKRDDVGLAWFRNQAMAAGEFMEARAIYEDAYSDLLTGQDPEIKHTNLAVAVDLAVVLRKTGEPDRADRLLDRALTYVRTQPRLGVWRGTLAHDVEILTLQGYHEEALVALRAAVDEGWRARWRYFLLYEPNLEPIRSYPEYQAIVSEIEADMAAQLELVREMERNGEQVLTAPDLRVESYPNPG